MVKIDMVEGENYMYSLRAKVFYHIQNDILNGVYKPGDTLTEKKLCEDLGVSRTPIREAIMQLELEGLVQSVPNKGVVVKGISTKDIEEIYTIRMMIEGFAAKLAAENITKEELDELKETVDFEEFYTTKNDKEHLIKFDLKFHELIFKAGKSNPLIHLQKTFNHYVQKARVTSYKTPLRAQKALEEHKAILTAIINKDADLAEKFAVQHIKNAAREYRN
ncbi:GntR family transcriptional regulator [Herbivorax sp. ANBcel31]|uniref:GntR family transcriptional regulator n=1 Tax=Herbivorax sp. ANBcel31 TaxID=3069754 RepID=UPI0027B03FB6|nr:GntR family transcriptional regulator [Herbivorax sp. ANBcel31]MDQ2085517.1 GntR family transcriptional regulator [Herbivorax sp. ANBcel31]